MLRSLEKKAPVLVPVPVVIAAAAWGRAVDAVRGLAGLPRLSCTFEPKVSWKSKAELFTKRPQPHDY